MRQHHDGPRHAQLTGREDWRSAAACRSADPDLFFPVSDPGASLAQAAEAKAICAGCPVHRQCLAFALRTGQIHGIWGGLTERERHVSAPNVTEAAACHERTEPTMTDGRPESIDHDELSAHNWRVSRLRGLGVPGALAEIYADPLDFHQIARLARRGCTPLLAIRIVTPRDD